jgi:hypothetical protein
MQTTGISLRRISAVLTSIVFLAGLSLPGCGGGGTATTNGGGTATPAGGTEAGSPANTEPEGEDAKIAAALAKLSPEDQAAAKAQKVCPVGDGPLGSMGPPVIVMAGDRKVFLCCDGCEQEFKDHMEKYLAKLDGGAAETTPEGAPAVVPDSQPEGGAEPARGESGT